MKKILLLIVNLLCFVIVFSQDNIEKQVFDIIKQRGEAKILIKGRDIENINTIADIVSLDYKKGDAWLAYVNKKEYRRFLSLGLKHSLYCENANEKALLLANTMDKMKNWDRYPTYEVYDSLMRRFVMSYPNICKLDTIGVSVNNRPILCLKISINPHIDIDKPKFFYSSTMHGDELTGYILMLRLADYLLKGYELQDARCVRLLTNMQIYINPLANPDGTYAGGNSNVSNSTRYNRNYVDLNRNFPSDILGQLHPDNEVWQPETQAFMNYAQANEFSLSANLHGGAEVLNYPYDCFASQSCSHSDRNWFIDVCKRFIDSIQKPSSNPIFFKDVSDEGYIAGGDWYIVSGSRQDYCTYSTYGREITFEVSSEKRISTSQLNNYWNYLKGGLLSYIENCHIGLEGYVRDSLTNQPLRAKIFIQGHDSLHSEVFSKQSTGYYYRPLFKGVYDIRYSLEGYHTKTSYGVLLTDTSITQNDVLLVRNTQGLGTKEEEVMRLKFYPNPASDRICVEVLGLSDEKLRYGIFDIMGRELSNGFIRVGKTDIDIASLEIGIYFLRVGDKMMKFIKDKK